MLANKPKTKILVDGGDPEETLRVKELIGFVDGQTTNPSLIAKNPEIRERIAAGHTLSQQEEKDEYRKIVQNISPLVGDADVSIEVFADLDTKAEEMFSGFPTPTLNIHARTKACDPQKCQWPDRFV
jgi:transaldolase